MRHLHAFVLLALLSPALVGCDQLGIESASSVAARREAEGKAIGGGCRHAARSLEVCYGMNARAEKAAVYAGWREMNDYMRENNIEPMPAAAAAGAAAASAPDSGEADGGEEPAKVAKAGKKH